MAKYDGQITELKNLLPGAKNILIALPVNSSLDKLSAGLALFLSLSSGGKQISVVCDDTIRVAQAHLFGIDHVQKSLPSTEGGNYVLTLEGVAIADPASPNGWKVPALENLDWYGENNNLNLVFHVVPGQSFTPRSVVPHSQGSGFDLIFVIGAPDLNSLGTIYSTNSQAFSGVHTANVDNQAGNTSFGATNILDSNASICEIMFDLIPSLGLSLDEDSASNLLVGIFDATANLSNQNVGPDTFMAVANCLRAGGKKPGETVVQPVFSVPPAPISQPVPTPQPGFDLSALMPKPTPLTPPTVPIESGPVQNDFPTPPVVSQNLAPEIPVGEAVTPGTELEAEPDWLTPKVFKGGQG